MSRLRQLGKNTFLVFIGSFGSKLISFVMLPFYTRWLSTIDYGVVDMIGVYQALLVGLITGAISDAIFVFPKNASYEKQKSYFTSGILFSFLTFTVSAFLFYLVKKGFEIGGGFNSFTQYTGWIYIMILFSFLQSFLQQFCRSVDKMYVFSIVGILLTLFTALFSFLLVPNYGIEGYLTAIVISNAIVVILTIVIARLDRYFSITSYSRADLMIMLKYSVPLMPNALMWWLFGSLNRPVLESYVGLAGIGVFAVAQKFPNLASVVFNIFGNSWQISVLEEYGREGFEVFYNKIFALVTLFIAVGVLGLSFLADWVVQITVGKEFYSAATYIPLLSVAMLFLCFSTIVTPVFSAVRISKYYFYSSVWSAIISVVLNILLIPSIGIYGAVISLLCSHLLMAVIRIYFSMHYVAIYYLWVYVVLAIIVLFNSIICTVGNAILVRFLTFIFSIVLIGFLFIFLNKKMCICSSLSSLKWR
ncbi:exopolysaccharide biosynthesis protein [Bacteroides xylanisolvens]|uniref:Exopolysaccharide biosynthesis protein n=1 Tax=Bacteroides xylanisolvens TaxID=371601 RepID=A0A415HFZ2_9BACE|nr:polysaccharide biosynthesis C-terminal domain-containing protein [Bacteroides xylanisolvens]RHK91523.1 exopolysaccharide biosynthesis protein [Bacteroides xylanisolvens]